MTGVNRNKVLIKNGSAIIEKGRNIFAVIAEVSKKSNGTAEVLSVLDVDVRTPVNAQFIGEFHL